MQFNREEESRKLVKSLQRQLIEVKKDKENEIQVGPRDIHFSKFWWKCCDLL